MKLAAILALLSLLGTSWACSATSHVSKTSSKIKLKWLEDQEGLPHMEITFADGTKDEILLKPDSENDCFYHGALKSDVDSEVEVDGCKGEVEIVAISSRLIPCGLVFLLFENNETFEIDPTEGISFNSTDALTPTASGFQGGAWQGDLPRTAVAKIHVRFDQTLVDMMGSQEAAKKKAKTIIDLSRVWFKRRHGLAMDINIEELTIKYYDGRITSTSERQLNALSGRGRQGNDDEHPTAWITASRNAWSRGGRAHRPGICRGKSYGLISEVFKDRRSDADNAALFAHELGHNLGMFHDFAKKHGGPGDEWKEKGFYGPCNDKGIMSYGDHPLKWSICSRDDQVETFKREAHRCMASGGGGGGGGGGPPPPPPPTGPPPGPPGSGCKCNGEIVPPPSWWAGIGSCGSAYVSCGAFCFVNEGDCPDQFLLYGLREYGYASCTACPQSRSKPLLKTAECPNGSSGFVGKGVGLLAAAGLLLALSI